MRDDYEQGDVDDIEWSANKIAAANAISGSEVVDREVVHQLRDISDILPENPRMMKRMINAYGFYRAVGILQEQTLEADWLARWIIIEQRWPTLAEHLVKFPEDIDILHESNDQEAVEKLDEPMKSFAKYPDVKAVINDKGDKKLTAENIRTISLGAEL